jgi:hypothetical protein
MKSPPWWRANAHEKSAVRAVPRWRNPVGDGAMRVRTRCPAAMTGAACGALIGQPPRFALRCSPRERPGGSQRGEAAREVGLDIGDVVEAHGNADHSLGDARGPPLLLGQPPV